MIVRIHSLVVRNQTIDMFMLVLGGPKKSVSVDILHRPHFNLPSN